MSETEGQHLDVVMNEPRCSRGRLTETARTFDGRVRVPRNVSLLWSTLPRRVLSLVCASRVGVDLRVSRGRPLPLARLLVVDVRSTCHQTGYCSVLPGGSLSLLFLHLESSVSTGNCGL